MDHEKAVAARRRLHTDARQRIYVEGESRWEWETRPEVIAIATEAGLTEKDLDQLSYAGERLRPPSYAYDDDE